MNSLVQKNDLAKTSQQVDYILIDGSSSMMDKWDTTIGAVDSYVDELKKQNIISHIYVHIFSSGGNLDLVAFHGPISEWEPLMYRLTCPGGMTPLYDAVALMARRMRDFDPPCGAITIATDGQEMGSNHTSLDQAKSYLDWCRAKGWPVTFIGADFSNASQAQALGADPSQAIGVQKALLPDAARNLARKRARHVRTGDDIGFSSDEQQQFGGYLAAPDSEVL